MDLLLTDSEGEDRRPGWKWDGSHSINPVVAVSLA